MQSSRNTTKNPTGDQLYAALNRKLKKSSANIAQRKLATGEYVMHQGRVVPANLVDEAEASEAETFARRPPLQVTISPIKLLPFQPLRVNLELNRLDSGVWIGSRKSVAATSVENLFRTPIHIKGAAPISSKRPSQTPKDGQLFAFDAKSGQMLPVDSNGKIVRYTNVGIKGSTRLSSKHQLLGIVTLKNK
ncbi:hypothetical protein ACEV6Q_00955 [Enterobacter ludwigii]|uniref:hypothetical protein n=1 Tax=Enterobacter ludwigii TaxID=299767 RepID=UPI003BEF2AD6